MADIPVTGGVMDTTAVTPQVAGASPVAPVGGLTSSVIGVCPNEAQNNPNIVFGTDQVADNAPFVIGADSDTPFVTNVTVMTMEVADPGTSTASGSGVRYTSAATDVAYGDPFANLYLNNTNPQITVDAGYSVFAVAP